MKWIEILPKHLLLPVMQLNIQKQTPEKVEKRI